MDMGSSMVSGIIQFFSRLIRTARAVRKCWRAGGVVQVSIAQIQRGEVLKGRRVLVTGGSSGIGLAIAKRCLAEGATVIITGRDEAKLKAVQVQINNPNLSVLPWDVSCIDQHDSKLVEVLEMAGGNLDVLVNNAGILLEQNFFSTTEDVWDKTYAVNSKAVFFLSQRLSQFWMQRKATGKILNISSTGGFLGAPYPYRMTKWDLVGLTSGLGQVLAPHGIIVNGIAPGRIATSMLGREDTTNVHDLYQPVQRLGLPEEVAELAVFLMSDAANYIVGQTIICDGGYTLKA